MLELLGEDETRSSALKCKSRLEADLFGPQLLFEVEELLGLELVVSGSVFEHVNIIVESLNIDIVGYVVSSNIGSDILSYEVSVIVVKAGVGVSQIALVSVVESGDDCGNAILRDYKLITKEINSYGNQKQSRCEVAMLNRRGLQRDHRSRRS